MLGRTATVEVSVESRVSSLCKSSISLARPRRNNQRSQSLNRLDHSKRLQSHKIHLLTESMLEELEVLLLKTQENKMMETTLSTSTESTNLLSTAPLTESIRRLSNTT
jgi:hypothetical protein